METIDESYYNPYDEIGRAFYDWERQIINLGCNLSDINVSSTGGQVTGDTLIHSSKLIHEYIHFLQNFCTAWGTPVFTDFALAYFKIGASVTESIEVINIPFDLSQLKTPLLIEGFVLRNQVKNRLNKYNLVQPITNGVLSNVQRTDLTNPNCVILTNGRIKVELGAKVIREHMAEMGTQLFLKKNDELIHEYFDNFSAFKSDGTSFSDKPEYWIVFEYFYGMNSLGNISRGVFHLMQQCLVFLNPEKGLLRFINWFETAKCKYNTKVSLFSVVEDWLKNENEIMFLHVGFTESVKHCEKLLALTDKHKEHDLFKFAHDIIKYSLDNTKRTTGGRFLFNLDDNFEDINFWKMKIQEFGTGFVKYLDTVVLHGSEQHSKEMQESFTFLISSSLIIKKLLDNRIKECPFLYDIPICKAAQRDCDNCITNPFLIVEDEDGKGCLFRNGVVLLGLQDRLNFS